MAFRGEAAATSYRRRKRVRRPAPGGCAPTGSAGVRGHHILAILSLVMFTRGLLGHEAPSALDVGDVLLVAAGRLGGLLDLVGRRFVPLGGEKRPVTLSPLVAPAAGGTRSGTVIGMCRSASGRLGRRPGRHLQSLGATGCSANQTG